jgi:hypothetical protein
MSDNMCDGSFVKMSSKTVAEMATKELEWIKQYREKKTQRAIESCRQKMVNGWWHRLWKKPVPTDQEVIVFLEFDIDMINATYGCSEMIAKRLLNACQYAEDIFISTEDLRVIS